MKVSIITFSETVNADTIDTINSIALQNYKKIESVIVTNDSSLFSDMKASANYDIGFKFVKSSSIDSFCNLLDGIGIAEGDIICVLYPGCVLGDEKVVGNMVNFFTSANIDVAYGDFISISNGVEKYEELGIYNPGIFMTGWYPSLQGTFFKNTVLKKYANIISSHKWARDYELLFHLFELSKHRILYVPCPLVVSKAEISVHSRIIKLFKFFEILSIVKRSRVCNFSQYLKFVLSIFKKLYL